MTIHAFACWACALLLACAAGCGKAPEEAKAVPAPVLKYSIDGSFDDWQEFKTAWTETGKEGFGTFGGDIDIKQFHYCNDDQYLYLFLECNPTVQELFEETGAGGIVAYLYLDSDSDESTGATKPDLSGNSAMLGSDIQIWIPIGVYVQYSATEEVETGCYVSYTLQRWSPQSEGFDTEVREESSRSMNSLIMHGKDGIEIAIPLSDLGKAKGDKCDLICVEWAHNDPENANRISIEIE